MKASAAPPLPRQLSGRGLAYWSDGKEERILYVTPGYRLIALDAKTGARIPAFGKDGVVDLKLDDDQTILPDLTTGEIGLQSAPVVAKDTIIIGAAFREGMTPKSMRNNKGYVRGFDVRTGKRLWIFHTIPMKGEFGYDTWQNGSAEYTGNTGVWTQITVDEQLGLGLSARWSRPPAIIMAATGPATICTARAWSASISRPASASGITSWCTIRCGTWTFRPRRCWPTSMSTARPIKAVAQPTKQGFLYVFDRVTGKPVWPIEERPVEKGDVPGEWYAPTQPFPTKPPAYSREWRLERTT